VNGSLASASAVTVSDNGVAAGLGGTLSGTGSVGNVIATATTPGATVGGIIDPGAANDLTGILTVGTGTGVGINLDAGSAFAFDFGGTAVGQYDRLSVVNGSTITLAGNFFGSLVGGYQPVDGDTFYVLLNNGSDAITGSFANTFLIGDQPAVTIGSKNFLVSYSANFLGEGHVGNSLTGGNDIAFTAVPEPGTAITLLGGLGMLAAFRRRRTS
jgi:hypothetical protein